MDLFNLMLGVLFVIVGIGVFLGIPAYYLRRGYRDGMSFWGDLKSFTAFIFFLFAAQVAMYAWHGELSDLLLKTMLAMMGWLIASANLGYAIGRFLGNRHRKIKG